MNGGGVGVNMKEDKTAVGREIINTMLIPIIGLRKLNTAVARLRPGLLAECGISALQLTLFTLVSSKGKLLDPITEISGVDAGARGCLWVPVALFP